MIQGSKVPGPMAGKSDSSHIMKIPSTKFPLSRTPTTNLSNLIQAPPPPPPHTPPPTPPPTASHHSWTTPDRVFCQHPQQHRLSSTSLYRASAVFNLFVFPQPYFPAEIGLKWPSWPSRYPRDKNPLKKWLIPPQQFLSTSSISLLFYGEIIQAQKYCSVKYTLRKHICKFFISTASLRLTAVHVVYSL